MGRKTLKEKIYLKYEKNHAHMNKVGHTSQFPFGIS